MTITLRSSQQSSSVISYRLMQQFLGGLVGQEERARGRERPDDGGEEAVVEGADALAAHDGAGGGEHGGAGAGDLRGDCWFSLVGQGKMCCSHTNQSLIGNDREEIKIKKINEKKLKKTSRNSLPGE